jgi:hypothetical protein
MGGIINSFSTLRSHSAKGDQPWNGLLSDTMIAKSTIALAFIGTIAAAAATPSWAQGAYFEGRGFGVGVGHPPYRDRDYRYREYNYVPRDRYRHCRTVTIHQDDGSYRSKRRCG